MLVYIIPPLFSPGRPLRKSEGPACRLLPLPYDSARGFRHVKRIKILSPETVRRKPPEGKKGTRFPSVTPGFRPTGRGNFTGSRTDCKPRANNGGLKDCTSCCSVLPGVHYTKQNTAEGEEGDGREHPAIPSGVQRGRCVVNDYLGTS